MTNEIETKLREIEAALQFYRRHLISSQSLRSILIDLYNLLEEEEKERNPEASKKNEK